MFWVIVFSIILLGLIFVLSEILFVPGGILGILGLIVILYGIYYGFSTGGTTRGYIVVGITIAVSLLAIIYAVRAKTWKRIALDTDNKNKFNVNQGIEAKTGETATAVTRLNPMGKIKLGDKYAEAISLSGFIDEGSHVVVHKIEGSKIYVKLKEYNHD